MSQMGRHRWCEHWPGDVPSPRSAARQGLDRRPAGFHPAAERVALLRPSTHSRGRNGIKSGMASSSIFSSISSAPPVSPEISMCLSKSAGL
jgi:hypothetical protein